MVVMPASPVYSSCFLRRLLMSRASSLAVYGSLLGLSRSEVDEEADEVEEARRCGLSAHTGPQAAITGPAEAVLLLRRCVTRVVLEAREVGRLRGDKASVLAELRRV